MFLSVNLIDSIRNDLTFLKLTTKKSSKIEIFYQYKIAKFYQTYGHDDWSE